MATSSITKEYKVKDVEKFNSLITKINEIYEKESVVAYSPNLEKGRKLLSQFSFKIYISTKILLLKR